MAERERARDDLAAFAAMAGHPLTGWQVAALRLGTFITAVVAPRQSGKSRSLALLALWWAFRRRGQRVLIVSAGEEAARRLLGMVRAVAARSPVLSVSIEDEQAGLVTLSNGSEIRSVPASERQVRGWAVDLLLIDEAALVSDELLLGAALPTTAARPDARVVMASSATVAAGAFYDHAVRGEGGSEHVRTFRWALTDCEWIRPTTIAAARESMSPLRFAAEYQGQFASGSDAFFTRSALERATADYRALRLEELAGPARVLAGVDWGATTDRSALVAIGRLPIEERVFAVAVAHRWPAGEPLHDVVDQIARSPAHFDTLAIETNGLGIGPAQELTARMEARAAGDGGARRPARSVVLDEEVLDAIVEGRRTWDPPSPAAGPPRFRTRKLMVHTTAEMKAAMYSALRLLIDQGRLVLPASAEDLIRELVLLRVDLTAGGVERIEASSGHDDMADALALACCPYRDRERRWRTLLTYYADPARPLPRAPLPPAAGALATVTTGAGQRVPATPIFQSVRGPEATLPPGLDLRANGPVPPRLHAARGRVRDALAAHPVNDQKEA